MKSGISMARNKPITIKAYYIIFKIKLLIISVYLKILQFINNHLFRINIKKFTIKPTLKELKIQKTIYIIVL